MFSRKSFHFKTNLYLNTPKGIETHMDISYCRDFLMDFYTTPSLIYLATHLELPKKKLQNTPLTTYSPQLIS